MLPRARTDFRLPADLYAYQLRSRGVDMPVEELISRAKTSFREIASILEKGVSQARVLYAFNSVNVEGWALYAEAEMKPFEPPDGQLIALQHRLMRAARAFIDPSLHLGRMTREEAFRVLEEDVVLSQAMALQEVERYTFRTPGQAPSYYVGYSRLVELRTDAERMLGKSFDRLSYHDFILAQGLLSPSLLRKPVMEEYVRPRLSAAPRRD